MRRVRVLEVIKPRFLKIAGLGAGIRCLRHRFTPVQIRAGAMACRSRRNVATNTFRPMGDHREIGAVWPVWAEC